jgi:hypothetical protein
VWSPSEQKRCGDKAEEIGRRKNFMHLARDKEMVLPWYTSTGKQRFPAYVASQQLSFNSNRVTIKG